MNAKTGMRRAAAAALAIATLAVLPAAAAAAPETPPGSDPPGRLDPRTFAHPGSMDRPNAFWFWNGALTEDELNRQLLEMRRGGVEEFFIHPRQGLGGQFGVSENDYYLSKDYFDKVGFVLRRARELGMHAWLYDELNWPSGYAGGRVLNGGVVDGRTVPADPEYIAHYLSVEPRDVAGGSTYDEEAPLGGTQGWSLDGGRLRLDGGEVGLTRDGADWGAYRMSFDATIDRVAAGWVLRARDAKNLVMVNLTSTSQNNPEADSSFGVHVRVNGAYRLIGGRIPAGKPIAEGTTYHVATEIDGSTVRLFLDGREVGSVTDPAIGALDRGRVGFRSDGAGGERAHIDNLEVTSLDGGERLFADDFSEEALATRYDAPIAERGDLIAALAARVPDGAGDCSQTLRSGTGRLDGDSLVELTDRVQDGRLHWQAPSGRWCVLWLVQHELTGYHPDLEPDQHYVDMLNPAATRKFIGITHESYARRFGSYLGSTIRGIFNDEPGFYDNFPDGRGGADSTGSVPWTPGLRGWLTGHTGHDIVRELPALWYDIGARTRAVRIDFHDALQDRYNQAHTKPLADWAANHGISLISNPLVEESLGDHKLIEGGDWFKMSRWYQIPGMDLIAGLNTDVITPKLNSSVAHAFGRGRNLAESFGAFGWDLTLQTMKRGISWEAAAGVDLTDNHAFYYSIEGGREHESPPSEFFQNLFWPHFPQYARLVGRLNYPARGATPVNRVGILYPTSTIEAEGTPYTNRGFFGNGPQLGPIDASFKAASSALLKGQLDFDYLSELQLAGDPDMGEPLRADGGRLRHYDSSYRVLVWPRTTTLSLAALRTVERFVAGGGRLVAFDALPQHEANGHDAELRDRLRELFGTDPEHPVAGTRRHGRGIARFVASSDDLVAAVREIDHDPDVVLSPERDAIRTRHVRRGPDDLWLVTNLSDQRVSTDVSVDRRGTPELWSPDTGRTAPAVAFRADGRRTVVPVQLEAYDSVWIVFRHGHGAPQPGRTPHVTATDATVEALRPGPGGTLTARVVTQRPGERYVVARWHGARYGGQVAVGDVPDPLALGGDWEVALERPGGPDLTRPLSPWTDLDPRYSGTARYTKRFTLPDGFLGAGRRVQLDLGDVHEIADVTLNGHHVGARLWERYRLDVTDALRPGENTLEVEVTNTQANAFDGAPLTSGLAGPVRLQPERVVDVPLQRGVTPTALDATVAPDTASLVPGAAQRFEVTLAGVAPGTLTGTLRAQAPDGWRVQPAEQPFALRSDGDQATQRLGVDVTAPTDAPDGEHTLTFVAETADGRRATATVTVRVSRALQAWEFATDGDTEGWAMTNQLTPARVSGGALSTSSTGGDPFMVQGRPLALDAGAGLTVEITMATSTGGTGQLFFTTRASPGFSEDKSTTFAVQGGGTQTYRVAIPPQSSPVTGLRLDPLRSTGDIRIESIRVFG